MFINLNQTGSKAKSGFTLVELLIAMAIGMIVLVAMSRVFTQQTDTYQDQEEIVEMQQNARAAMDLMVREIRMAGFDPTDTANATITSADTSSITFTQDITDDTGTGDPDGDTGDADESITYSFDNTNKRIERDTGGGGQPVAENIQSLQFSYWDEDGNALSTPVSNPADIRKIEITITAETASSSSRTYTLTSTVTPRNMAY